MRDDFSRYVGLYFILHESDVADAFEQILADLEGVPSEVVVVRSDDDGVFNERMFGRLCRERNITQEFITNYR